MADMESLPRRCPQTPSVTIRMTTECKLTKQWNIVGEEARAEMDQILKQTRLGNETIQPSYEELSERCPRLHNLDPL